MNKSQGLFFRCQPDNY